MDRADTHFRPPHIYRWHLILLCSLERSWALNDGVRESTEFRHFSSNNNNNKGQAKRERDRDFDFVCAARDCE